MFDAQGMVRGAASSAWCREVAQGSRPVSDSWRPQGHDATNVMSSPFHSMEMPIQFRLLDRAFWKQTEPYVIRAHLRFSPACNLQWVKGHFETCCARIWYQKQDSAFPETTWTVTSVLGSGIGVAAADASNGAVSTAAGTNRDSMEADMATCVAKRRETDSNFHASDSFSLSKSAIATLAEREIELDSNSECWQVNVVSQIITCGAFSLRFNSVQPQAYAERRCDQAPTFLCFHDNISPSSRKHLEP
ncbi:hypothetical protein E4U42_001817 [Claviceps africana]|uniref:Uncharacterized protein n=1 Tax=Claviceps africana TaxID=83212 RepID=A0A8K0JA97_9HYPO|nr:hypothetical protein E4U42_001817 [Claviceps africana]